MIDLSVLDFIIPNNVKLLYNICDKLLIKKMRFLMKYFYSFVFCCMSAEATDMFLMLL